MTNSDVTNRCDACGANLALVGRAHNCRPIPAVILEPRKLDPVRELAGGAAVRPGGPQELRQGDGGGLYKYRDPDKWREYMKGYMRARRAKKP
jgi:hypothetical protein